MDNIVISQLKLKHHACKESVSTELISSIINEEIHRGLTNIKSRKRRGTSNVQVQGNKWVKTDSECKLIPNLLSITFIDVCNNSLSTKESYICGYADIVLEI